MNPQRYEPIGRAFTDKGWRVLSEKPTSEGFKPYYSVLEHDGLQGRVVKHAGKRKPDDQVAGGAPIAHTGDFLELDPYCSLLRIAMVDRIRQICAENPDEFDGVTLPKKELCEIQPGRLQDESLPIDQRFLIVAEKVNCLSWKETVDAIDGMSQHEQEALADKLVSLVTKVGLADATFSNVRLGRADDLTEAGNRKIFLVDTEPSNVMILDQGWFNNLFAFQSSLEQAGRIGTYALRILEAKNWVTDQRAPHFVTRIKEHIETQKSNNYSKPKIGAYLISVIALTALYKKTSFGKYRKTYIFAVLSPLDIGLAKIVGYSLSIGIHIGKFQIIAQDFSLSAQEKMDRHLQNPWIQRAARIQGQGRMIMSEEQIIAQMRAQGLA